MFILTNLKLSLLNKKKKKKKKKKTPADKFLELIFRNNFFYLQFSKMCLR